MLSGTVTSITFKGVHFEIIVDIGGFKWMIQTTDYEPVGKKIGLEIEPDAIHIMKNPNIRDCTEITAPSAMNWSIFPTSLRRNEP